MWVTWCHGASVNVSWITSYNIPIWHTEGAVNLALVVTDITFICPTVGKFEKNVKKSISIVLLLHSDNSLSTMLPHDCGN